MVASLGPETRMTTGWRNGLTNATMAEEKGGDVAFGEEFEKEACETGEAGAVVNGIIDIRADNLSCARVLLAASRTFAMVKIEAVAGDVLSFVRHLG